jgi:WD40 repeat protein
MPARYAGERSLISTRAKSSRRRSSTSLKPRAFCLALLAFALSTRAQDIRGQISSPIQPQLVPQLGHPLRVFSGAFSPDGQFVLTGGDGGSVCLWETATGREVRRFRGHTGWVKSVGFSPNGDLVLTGAFDDKTVRLWETATGHEVRRFGARAPAVFSPDGRFVLAHGKDDNSARLFDSSSGQELLRFEGGSLVAFSPDGRFVLTGGPRGSVRLWETTTGRELKQFKGLLGAVDSVAFSPDGRSILAAASMGTPAVLLWDVLSTRRLQTFDGCCAVAFSVDGQHVLTGNLSGNAALWEVASGRLVRLIEGPGNAPFKAVTGVAFSPDGRFVLTANSLSRYVVLSESATGHTVRAFFGVASGVHSVAVSPDGRFMLTGNDGPAVLREFSTGHEVRHFGEQTSGVESIVFSHDGRLVLGCDGTVVRLWDTDTGREVERLEQGAGSTVSFVALSPDQRFVATGDFGDNTRLWNLATRQMVWQVKEPSGGPILTPAFFDPFSPVAFSPDGHSVLRGSWWFDKVPFLLEATTGRELQHFTGHTDQVFSVTFSRDGRFVLTGSRDATARLWEVASGQEVRRFSGHGDGVDAVAFSPDADGRFILTGSHDATARLWDKASGQEVRRFQGHTDSVDAVAFSPSGEFVLTGSNDGTARLWNAVTGKEVATLVSFWPNGWAVIAPDGRFDASNLEHIDGLHWVMPDDPMRALPIEIFMRDYYKPNVLSKLLGGEKLPDVRPLSSLNRAQPTLEVVKVEPEAERRFVSVTVKVTNTHSEVQKDATGKFLESGAYDLHLFRDGQLVGQWPEVSQVAEPSFVRTGSTLELESWRSLHEIKLVNGEYVHTFRHIRLPQRTEVEKVQFTAYGFNSDRVKSLTAPLVEYSVPKLSSGAQAAGTRRAYLISMGVNANQSHWNLDFAVPSVQDAARLLHEKLASDYEVVDLSLFSTLAPDSPRVLLQQATKANLKAVLDVLAGKAVSSALREQIDPSHKLRPATPDDAVVLFISSHGYADPGDTFYVVPYDTGVMQGITEDLLRRCQAHAEDASPVCTSAKRFLERTISSREFAAWWAGVDAGEMVMILDSCHSAAVTGREFRPGPLGDAGFGQLSYDKGMRILTATQPDKTARATLVQGLGHSLLVEALLEEAKANPQGTIAEWLRDTVQRVPVLTHRLYHELREADVQLPELFDFAIERH